MENKIYFNWTEEYEKFVREHAKGTPNKELVRMLNEEFGTNLTLGKLENFKKRKGIYSGINCHFQKGHVPANKGKHQPTTGRMAETQFKKGNRPPNWVPIGTKKRRVDGWVIKVQDGCMNANWQWLNHYVWEQSHGTKVPEGHKVIFLDGNIDNCDPDNLMLVTDGDLAIINNKIKLSSDQDVNKAIVLIAKLRSASYQKKKGDK